MVKLSLDRVQRPDGSTTELEVVHHPGAVAVVPLTADGEVLLIRQFRYATGEWLLEVPAGKLDSGERPEQAAARELAEEIGQSPGELVDLGWIWTTPGFTNERIWLFLARQLTPAQQNLEADEFLTVERIPLEEAADLARTGEIRDGKSICALLRADAALHGASR